MHVHADVKFMGHIVFISFEQYYIIRNLRYVISILELAPSDNKNKLNMKKFCTGKNLLFLYYKNAGTL